MSDPSRIGHLVTADLLAALREVFPLRRPLVSDSERSIFMQSGEQSVIEFMERQFAERLAQAMERS